MRYTRTNQRVEAGKPVVKVRGGESDFIILERLFVNVNLLV